MSKKVFSQLFYSPLMEIFNLAFVSSVEFSFKVVFVG